MMESKIAKHLRMDNQPVAVLWTDEMPASAVHFKEDRWGCVVALIKAASQGKIAAAANATTVCRGGKVGLGFHRHEPGRIEYFLSTGNDKMERCERYKKTPELAWSAISNMPEIHAGKCMVFKPLSMVKDTEKPVCVIFMVNADQMSGLATLANFDQEDTVVLRFASGCSQAVLYPIAAEENGEKTCYIGFTDPSARKVIGKEQLAFSIPYSRFLEMEQNADESFFITDTWEFIQKRI